MFPGKYDTNLPYNLHSQALMCMYILQGILHNAEKLKRKYFSSNFILLQQLHNKSAVLLMLQVLESS